MLISASGRTDIPAYYSEWFFNRVAAGFACVRNPYYPEQIQRYALNASVVDAIVFCTKNPVPMLGRIDELRAMHPYFFVTITPYGTDIEPNVPAYPQVVESVVELASIVGVNGVSWRYDPIFLDNRYTVDRHVESFREISRGLRGATKECVISFVQFYGKTLRNFPGLAEVTPDQRKDLLTALVPIAKESGITIRTCADIPGYSVPGLAHAGCITSEVLSRYAGFDLKPLPGGPKRNGCKCDMPSRDIGAYNSCPHGCKYCYANGDLKQVARNYASHDPSSPLIIGHIAEGDSISDAKQESFRPEQLSFGLF